MQLIFAFFSKMSISSVADGVVSDAYDFSPIAATYSTTIGEYSDHRFPEDVINTVKVVDSETGNSEKLTEDQLLEILTISNLVYSYFSSHSYPFSLSDFRTFIQNSVGDSVGNIMFGDIDTSSGAVTVDWISWDSFANGNNRIRLWFRSEAFEQQYDGFEIKVVPPLDDLDSFFGAYGSVATQLLSQNTTYHTERSMLAMNGQPFTYSRHLTFNYVNHRDPVQSTPCVWGVLIHGIAGDSPDIIKAAIVSYALENSNHTEQEWLAAFPELFKRTEFVFYPRWDSISIPNVNLAAALYSSIQNPAECLRFAKEKWPELPQDHLDRFLTILPLNYKGIALLGTAGVSNGAGVTSLTDIFPDYIPVPTGSLDFARMQIKTREWLILLHEAVVAAETATEFSSLKQPFRRIIRHGVIYVSMHYDGVNYLVAARSNLA